LLLNYHVFNLGLGHSWVITLCNNLSNFKLNFIFKMLWLQMVDLLHGIWFYSVNWLWLHMIFCCGGCFRLQWIKINFIQKKRFYSLKHTLINLKFFRISEVSLGIRPAMAPFGSLKNWFCWYVACNWLGNFRLSDKKFSIFLVVSFLLS
jgi:hypothetical protein